MNPPQEGRNTGAPSLRGLQGRSATGLNGQAAKEEVSALWRGGLDAGKYFWRSGREKCFSLDIPFNRTSDRIIFGWPGSPKPSNSRIFSHQPLGPERRRSATRDCCFSSNMPLVLWAVPSPSKTLWASRSAYSRGLFVLLFLNRCQPQCIFSRNQSLDSLHEQTFLILAILVFVDAGIKKVDFL